MPFNGELLDWQPICDDPEDRILALPGFAQDADANERVFRQVG